MKQEHEIMEQVRAAQGDIRAADELVRQYMPFIKAQTAKFTNRIPRDEEDALSVAMFAFHEAAMRYDRARGSFLKYAATAIRSRLIDLHRREKRHAGLLSLDMQAGEDDDRTVAETLVSGDCEISLRETRAATQSEIKEFAQQLMAFDLSLSDIADNCPKQDRTLAACHRALQTARSQPEILEQLLRTKKLPMNTLAAASGVERKTLERHRKYLVAIFLAYTNGFEMIRGHLSKTVPQRLEGTA